MARGRVYVVQVVGGREERMRRAIARRLGTLAEDCFVPECELGKKVHGTWKPVRSLLFPGYVFVQTAEPRALYEALPKINGLTRMLGVDGNSFGSLSDDEVAWLDAVTSGGTHAMGISQGVQEGDHIVVTEGPLRGREADIVKVDRHKRLAWLEVRMFGRQTQVKVGLEVVRKR